MASRALVEARKLLRSRGRRHARCFLAEGPHVVADALDAGAALERMFVREGEEPGLLALRARAEAGGVDVREVSAADLATVAETETPQGVVAVVALPSPPGEPLAAPGSWLLLDGVQDPGNVGTLLRAAEAFGARGAVLGAGSVDPWGGKVVRAAQGAHFRLDLLSEAHAQVELASFLDEVGRRGGEIWAADLGGESIYTAPPPPDLVVLALGNEARGVSEAVAARAARRVAVPQTGRADSLNVAMAGSILLSWLASRPRG